MRARASFNATHTRVTEYFPLFRVFDRFIDEDATIADIFGGDQCAFSVHTLKSDFESCAFLYDARTDSARGEDEEPLS